jgi:hypothetical protein
VCGGDDAVGVLEQREEDLTVGVRAHRGRDLPLELLDLRERLERANEREDELPAGVDLELAGATLGSAAELSEQLGRGLAAAVMLADEERLADEESPEALDAEGFGVGRARVALQERERDRAVKLAEQADRCGQNRSSSVRS